MFWALYFDTGAFLGFADCFSINYIPHALLVSSWDILHVIVFDIYQTHKMDGKISSLSNRDLYLRYLDNITQQPLFWSQQPQNYFNTHPSFGPRIVKDHKSTSSTKLEFQIKVDQSQILGIYILTSISRQSRVILNDHTTKRLMKMKYGMRQ